MTYAARGNRRGAVRAPRPMCPDAARHTLPAVPVTPAPLRVLVVDADHRVRQSVAGLLTCVGDSVEVVGATGDVASAVALAASTDPDVLLVDPRLPDVDAGLAMVTRLRRERPAMRVVVMGWSDSLENPAMECGAAFVQKLGGSGDFLDELRDAWSRPARTA